MPQPRSPARSLSRAVFKVPYDGYMGDPGHTDTRAAHAHACAAEPNTHTCATHVNTNPYPADTHGPASAKAAHTDGTSAWSHVNRRAQETDAHHDLASVTRS
jgi:hypothetical protein